MEQKVMWKYSRRGNGKWRTYNFSGRLGQARDGCAVGTNRTRYSKAASERPM